MDMKKGMICLSIIVILTLSIPNVAAASANKQTTNIHSSYALDAPVKERPILVLMLSNNTTAVNTSVYFFGAIATGTKSQLNYIEGATINIQRMSYDGTTWYTEDTVTTMSGKYSGIFSVYITPKDPGTYIYRATYDGNNTYLPAVSDVVVLTAY